MNLNWLIDEEEKLGFDDVNAIRDSGIRSFLDEWVVTGLLGRGSFGNVYQIVKPQEGLSAQYCALKICQVVNDEDAEIRTQEIETQKLLDGHTNAVQIEDFALISREPPRVSYLLIRMELLRPLPEDGLSERETIRMGIDICRVLEKCASMEPKLIHCDIKPANILMTADGRYKLGDFGTAKTLQATMTYTGNRGTPLYMAPEVASYTGYDSRCDIFSLGYAMLTMLNGGKHPYQDAGERTDILREMYTSRKLPHIKGVSYGLMKIIRKMIAPNLSVRYSRASAVRRDLEQYVRKQEEAERSAVLEAERQADLARKKGKTEREKDIRTAEDTLKRAQSNLDTARNRNGVRSDRLTELENEADKASRVLRYVVDGETYQAAIKKVANGSGKNGWLRLAVSPKKYLIAGVAILAVICAASLILFPSEGSAKNPENTGPLSAVISEEEATTGLIYGMSEDGTGVVVTGYDNSYGDLFELKVPGEYDGAPVVGIEADAFYDFRQLRSVIISDGVVKIGDNAFYGCSSMEKLVLPDTLKSIGYCAFYNCDSLEKITVPGSMEYIGNVCFGYCDVLRQVELSEGINAIEISFVMGCDSLKELVIPDSVKWIFNSLLDGHRIENITFCAPNPPEYYGIDIEAEKCGWVIID